MKRGTRNAKLEIREKIDKEVELKPEVATFRWNIVGLKTKIIRLNKTDTHKNPTNKIQLYSAYKTNI